MKVMLMAEWTWNKRPPRMLWVVPAAVSWDYVVERITGPHAMCWSIASASAVKQARGADRWWLVEADSAEAGRALIVANVSSPLARAANVQGRILASGGKHGSR